MDFSWFWVAWIALFAIIEGAALLNKKKGDTLSENVWRWFPKNTVRGIALFAFMAWLFMHFISAGEV